MFINSTVADTIYSNLFLSCTFVYCTTLMEPSYYVAAMYFQLYEQVGTEFQPVSARKRSHSLHGTYQLPCAQ
jgi:hypothetical protein